MAYQVYVQSTPPGGDRNQWKRLVAGSGITFVRDEKTLTVHGAALDDDTVIEALATATSGLEADLRNDFTNASGVWIKTASNLGASGVGIFSSKSAADLRFKNIVGQSPITVHNDGANTITVKTTAEANTASNVGTSGTGFFLQKSGVDLQFKKIVTGLGLRAPIVSASSVRIQESGTINRPFRELASANGVTANLSLSNNFYIDLNHAVTMTLTNPVDGGKYLFVLRNRGSKTISFPVAVKFKGGIAPTLTSASGSVDAVTLAYQAKLGIYLADVSYDFK